MVSGCLVEDKPEKISYSDIKKFGWEHVGKKVFICGSPEDFYACYMPSNKGAICSFLRLRSSTNKLNIIFDKNFKSNDIKPYEYKFSKFIGVIEERDFNNFGGKTSRPALVVYEIKSADNSCR